MADIFQDDFVSEDRGDKSKRSEYKEVNELKNIIAPAEKIESANLDAEAPSFELTDDFLSKSTEDFTAVWQLDCDEDNSFNDEDKKEEPEKCNILVEDDVVDANNEAVNLEPKVSFLEELADSDFIQNRQMAAKSIIEYLHQARSNKEALHTVISVMCKLFEDGDFLVRSEVMEQIPSIALYCQAHTEECEEIGILIRQQIVPHTIKTITDSKLQDRKIGHSTLLVLLENNIIDESQLTEWICPLVASLATSGTPEDVSVMCKMVPIVGKDITVRFFLEPFISLCSESSSVAREVCMLHFGNVCKVLGREITECTLLSVFLDFCKMESNVVNEETKIKCIDICIDLATVVSPSTRDEILAGVYMEFLADKSWGMVVSAFHSLGKFISTFEDPSKSDLLYKNGRWIGIPVEENVIEEVQLNDTNCFASVDPKNANYFDSIASKISSSSEFLEEMNIHDFSYNIIEQKVKSKIRCNLGQERRTNRSYSQSHLHRNLFNNFQFWRTPLPELEFDLDKTLSTMLVGKVHDEEDNLNSSSSHLDVRILSSEGSMVVTNTQLKDSVLQKVEKLPQFGIIPPDEDDPSGEEVPMHLRLHRSRIDKENCRKSVHKQNIVPPELLLKYAESLPIEEEGRICVAYYFPSVACTLGRENWPCIKGTFHMLATDTSISVCKTVASYMHELALILGRNITEEDLFPVFCDMLKIRHGEQCLLLILLKHISQFLRYLKPSDRNTVLMLVCRCWHFMPTRWKNEEWRCRLTFGEQLITCVELCTSYEALHLFSVAVTLLQDKVCSVRKAGVELLALSMKSISTYPKSSDFFKLALPALDEKYRKSDKWQWRQLYVYICQELAIKKSFQTEFYVDEIIPNLFSLASDRVANVRLAVARCVCHTLLQLDFLPTIQKTHYPLLLEVLCSLQNDKDRDVRQFAHFSISIFNVPVPKE